MRDLDNMQVDMLACSSPLGIETRFSVLLYRNYTLFYFNAMSKQSNLNNFLHVQIKIFSTSCNEI